MKIYSEITKEIYDDVAACEAAEAKFAEKQEQLKAENARVEALVNEEKAAVSKKKKELSDAVERANEEYIAATKVYETERARAQEIIKEAQKQADEIMSNAAKSVRKASEAKMAAVTEFNKSFGPYRTVITGAQAVDEYNRVVTEMLRSFWNW